MRLAIPDFSLVVLIGATGSGKSTFASTHFLETEVVSSDRCRALVADDETDQSATKDAFDVLYTIVAKRLAARRLTVIDATNVRREDRAKGIEIARKFHALPVAIVLDLPPELNAERNKTRDNRNFGARVVYDQVRLLRKSLRDLRREGYRAVYVFDNLDAIEQAIVVREPLYTDRRTDSGPFDIIGDVHGCMNELTGLLSKLGYRGDVFDGKTVWRHPEGRRAVFVGDIVDRGPDIVGVLRLVMEMVHAGTALCVQGNHENKLARKLDGRNVTVSHGLEETLAQFDALPEDERMPFIQSVRAFIEDLRTTTGLTTEGSLLRTLVFVKKCTVAVLATYVNSRSMGKRRARQTSSVYRFATTGLPSIAGKRSSFTDTRQFRRRNGSTRRFVSIPVACMAGA